MNRQSMIQEGKRSEFLDKTRLTSRLSQSVVHTSRRISMTPIWPRRELFAFKFRICPSIRQPHLACVTVLANIYIFAAPAEANIVCRRLFWSLALSSDKKPSAD